MLQYDCGVGNKRPEIVGLESRIALEVLEKGSLIGIVIRI
jgi:hypothetical protein